MKVTNQACLQFLTTATTAMATVLAQRDDGNGVISPITKPNNGQDNIIDQRPNQKTPSFFNDGDESSSLTFGHNKVTTSTTGSSSFPNNDKVLRNKSMKPCRDTLRNQGINNKDADTGILECVSEVQQSHRRLVDIVCPPPMPDVCPNNIMLANGDTLSCTDYQACRDFDVTFEAESTVTCNANRACLFMDATGAGTMTCTEYYSCYFASVALQNGGELICSERDSCRYVDARGAGTMTCTEYVSCVGSRVTLQSGGELICSGSDSCRDVEVTFEAGSTITCSDQFACFIMEATGAGTMTCPGVNSCISATVALQNGGQLECDFEDACFGADVSFDGSGFMRCLTADACADSSPDQRYGNSITATASGGTLLCRGENSCLTSFDLKDNSFLLICEDTFSCASNENTEVKEIANICVVCVQPDSCSNLSDDFPIGANKNEAQIAGICTPDQIATMCNEIRPELAFNLDFGNGPVCTSSSPSTSLQPSTSPSTSLQPSMSPSDIPTDSYQPSMAPSVPPSTSPQPSLAPSKTPTTSPQPSLAPSVIPSSGPSITPSQTPTTSIQTSVVPTKPPTTSLQPSLAPSDMPNTMSKPSPMSRPSLAPFKTPGTGKNGGQKDGNGKKGGSGGKKGVNGGKKRHPNTGSNKAKIAKVENIVMREP